MIFQRILGFFFNFLKIPSSAYFILQEAFVTRVSRRSDWDYTHLDEAQKRAAEFCQQIYQRGPGRAHPPIRPPVKFDSAKFENVFTICDENFYLKWQHLFETPPDVLLKASEENKSLASINQIFSAVDLASKTWQIIGGGIVLDIGLFAADLLKKPAVIFPTTLLAMVDVAVGGKCGVNYLAKNQLGSFAEPKEVYVDSRFLDTLAPADVRNGCSEAIKHALLIGDTDWATKIAEASANLDSNYLKNEIPRLLKVKEQIVEIDPFEKCERHVLNFGHTIGHAIETVYPQLPHGVAVAWGMLIESFFAVSLNFISNDDFLELKKMLYASKIIVQTQVVNLSVAEDLLIEAMLKDKKKFKRCTNQFCAAKKISVLFRHKKPSDLPERSMKFKTF